MYTIKKPISYHTCDLCGYKTYRKGSMTRHLQSKKHQNRINLSNELIEPLH